VTDLNEGQMGISRTVEYDGNACRFPVSLRPGFQPRGICFWRLRPRVVASMRLVGSGESPRVIATAFSAVALPALPDCDRGAARYATLTWSAAS
jgi:hypothetical protein